MAANANATASSDEAAKARAAEQAILADVAARLNRALYLLERRGWGWSPASSLDRRASMASLARPRPRRLRQR